MNTGKLKNTAMGLLLSVLAISGTTTSAAAKEGVREGHEIGNGGGAWVCQNNDNINTIRWAKLVDLYEGRTEFGLIIPNIQNRNYDEIIDTIMVRRLFTVSEGLFKSINKELELVKQNLVEVDADLEVVDDALFRIRPSQKECLAGRISYVQLANYTNYGKILLQQNLFNDASLNETDKAALMIHEAVYAYLRKSKNVKNSVLARQVVGLLFSMLPLEELKKQLQKVLKQSLPTDPPRYPDAEMSFVSIKAGAFQMGSPSSEKGRNNDEVVHSVTLTKDFEIQQTEVTQAHWFLVMGYNPSRFKSKENCPEDYLEINGAALCPNHPVERVSWFETQDFIKKLNEGNDGYAYRLPTEAEWEYAARGGTQTAYSFGDDASYLRDYAWYSENSGSQARAVGSKKANQYDLYDMHGNVWEWVQDWYASHPSGSQRDPAGAASGSSRVMRGGGWYFNAQYSRSGSRSYNSPGNCGSSVGFRLVRTAK